VGLLVLLRVAEGRSCLAGAGAGVRAGTSSSSRELNGVQGVRGECCVKVSFAHIYFHALSCVIVWH